MARLEDITVGSKVKGLTNNEIASIVAVQWYGNAVLEVTFKDSKGRLANQLIYRENEESIEILDSNLPWSFDADGNLLRLTSEAYRITGRRDLAERCKARHLQKCPLCGAQG